MQTKISKKKTIEIINKMRMAKIGDTARLDKITKFLLEQNNLEKPDTEYLAMLTRLYKDGNVTRTNSKNYHMKLSPEDLKPACSICGEKSLFYCNMNDAYFCEIHVVGHDENEF